MPQNNTGHIRLNHYIAQAGLSSRRGADTLIQEGNVKVNGKKAQLGQKVDTKQDTVQVRVDTAWKTIEPVAETVIFALNKPPGYITSMKKQRNRDLIIKHLLPPEPRVFPVGRLDKDSEGLLLLTNDGDFAQELTHPSSHIEKTYIVHCTFPRGSTENALKSRIGRVAKGIRLDGKKTMPAEISILRFLRKRQVELEITLREGRNRQIRRMLGTINLEVIRLIRTRIGKLHLEELNIEQGKYTEVQKNDIV